jgi:hypothetical protein
MTPEQIETLKDFVHRIFTGYVQLNSMTSDDVLALACEVGIVTRVPSPESSENDWYEFAPWMLPSPVLVQGGPASQ